MLSEKQIRKEIWQIISSELNKAMWFARKAEEEMDKNLKVITPKGFNLDKHKTVFGFYREQIKKRINKLLNDNDAILVYQP